MAEKVDPYKLLVRNPDSTFFLRAGSAMPEFGVEEGDMLVVDRGAEALDGKRVVVALDGELRLMSLARRDGQAFLSAGCQEMEITGREHVYVWGVLMWVLREM